MLNYMTKVKIGKEKLLSKEEMEMLDMDAQTELEQVMTSLNKLKSDLLHDFDELSKQVTNINKEGHDRFADEMQKADNTHH